MSKDCFEGNWKTSIVSSTKRGALENSSSWSEDEGVGKYWSIVFFFLDKIHNISGKMSKNFLPN